MTNEFYVIAATGNSSLIVVQNRLNLKILGLIICGYFFFYYRERVWNILRSPVVQCVGLLRTEDVPKKCRFANFSDILTYPEYKA